VTSDLIDRLRTNPNYSYWLCIAEAADEIERLTAENAELQADAMAFDDTITKVARLRLELESENMRLQARVTELEEKLGDQSWAEFIEIYDTEQETE